MNDDTQSENTPVPRYQLELVALEERVRELEMQVSVCLEWMNRAARKELEARGLSLPTRTVPTKAN